MSAPTQPDPADEPAPRDAEVTSQPHEKAAFDDDGLDRSLLLRVARRDLAALGALAERHEAAMLGLAHGILDGDRAHAADAVQEAWVRAIRHAGSFAQRSSVKTWLCRIAINRALSLRVTLRAQARDRTHLNAELAAARLATVPAPPAHSPARVRDLVAALPEHQRIVLLLCYSVHVSHEQAAHVLDIPLGTLKSRLSTALSALRRILEEDERL
ncbi:sigma-70 family RNA polymerase sigma factor [soil metagenome]